MADTYFLVVQSRDRVSGTSTDFWYQLQRHFRMREVSLVNVTIPCTYYTMAASNNRIIFVHSVDGLQTATVAPGFYTSSTISAAVAAALNAVSTVTYTVTYSSASGKLTITPSAGTISFSAGSSSAPILGIGSGTVAATSVTLPNVIDLSPSKNLFISIDDTTTNAFTASRSSTFVIPVDVTAAKEYIVFNEYSGFAQTTAGGLGTAVKQFRIKLTDDAGSPLELNGAEWTMILRVRA